MKDAIYAADVILKKISTEQARFEENLKQTLSVDSPICQMSSKALTNIKVT